MPKAYGGFGMEMPETPPRDLPECVGCHPHLNATKRTRAKAAPVFIA